MTPTNYIDRLAAEIRQHTPDSATPDDLEQEDSDQLFRLYALLGLVRGPAVTASDVHDAWSVWMLSREPDHSSIKPFEQLDSGEKHQDDPFVLAIRRALTERD